MPNTIDAATRLEDAEWLARHADLTCIQKREEVRTLMNAAHLSRTAPVLEEAWKRWDEDLEGLLDAIAYHLRAPDA